MTESKDREMEVVSLGENVIKFVPKNKSVILHQNYIRCGVYTVKGLPCKIWPSIHTWWLQHGETQDRYLCELHHRQLLKKGKIRIKQYHKKQKEDL
jgi:hypothetical protein